MNADSRISRLLGAAFLLVVVTSLSSNLVLGSATGSGSMSDILVNVSNQVTLMRIGVLGEMITSSAIIALAVLLYIVLSQYNRHVALVALGWWLVEALFLPISKMGDMALIRLSQDFVQAGAPAQSYFQTLGEFLYNGVHSYGSSVHMWFYCIGGLLWYYLFFKSRYVPRAISLFGLVAVAVGLVGIVFEFLGFDVPVFAYLPVLPFELSIGLWLVLRGIRDRSAAWQ